MAYNPSFLDGYDDSTNTGSYAGLILHGPQQNVYINNKC